MLLRLLRLFFSAAEFILHPTVYFLCFQEPPTFYFILRRQKFDLSIN